MPGNFFTDFPSDAVQATAETFETILAQSGLRIERIVSTGQASPPGFWYCQPQGEWVIVLQGAAGVRLEDDAFDRVLHAGDYLHIPARCRHRVVWTQPDIATVWLAVHYGGVDEVSP